MVGKECSPWCRVLRAASVYIHVLGQIGSEACCGGGASDWRRHVEVVSRWLSPQHGQVLEVEAVGTKVDSGQGSIVESILPKACTSAHEGLMLHGGQRR